MANRSAHAALVVGSLLTALLVLELGCRAATGTLGDWHNIILKQRIETKAQTDGRHIYDPDLGWAPHPSYSFEGSNNDAHGWRLTPYSGPATLAEPPVLVVGDSIGHGDELSDAEAWPTLLQAKLQRRTINAAVSGYGFDQIVLRAEMLVRETKPAVLVVSFAADDLRRSEMKRVWGVEKPYFERVDGKLVLRNSPAPPSPTPAQSLDIWHWLFGWSVLVDTVLTHQGWQYEWSIDHERVQPRGEGQKLACPLVRRIADLHVPTLVVAEYNRWVFMDADYQRETRQLTELVLKCATDAGLQALDMFEPIDDAVRALGIDAIYRSSHPGPRGAELASEKIAAYIPPR